MIKNLLFGSALIESTSAHIGLAILRIYTGLSMALAHGLGKIPPSEGFIEGTGAMGFPLPAVFAWLAGLSEFAGGLLLALGLMTRPAAFFMGSTMFVAAFVRHGADPFARQEKALIFLAIAVTFVCIGAGKYGIDAWVRARTGSY
ncbi:MAG: putative oxidoreductase [Planctomycetota bacterium]|jgi:putative oxidoreductase